MKEDAGPPFRPADSSAGASDGAAASGDPRSRSGGARLSKRAARRLIQRAFVLVGRDRHIRQNLREARLTTLWAIEDWKLTWTLELDRGKLHFERRPAKCPDLTLTWLTAEGFFRQVESSSLAGETLAIGGGLENRRVIEPVCRTFCKILSEVMRNPFDDAGTRLA